ncbi:Cys-tRNA(Pro) deacylase, partial [Oceanospirillaceae bacterium]|nr:Cys-tRNA(Pro) deacylase [Oceanospirillaceae bacterium]
MTPAIDQLKKLGIAHSLHEYTHDASAASYGLEAATKLGVHADIVFKTLVVETHTNTLAVAVLPVG